jgi:hypothetical protein
MEVLMPHAERLADRLHGLYHDVVRGPGGAVLHDPGWRSNAIVLDCRRLLASLMGGQPALGIQGLAVGAGLAAWDMVGPPPASPAQAALVDPSPFVVPLADLAIDFIDGGLVTAAPSNRLQIVASLGPGEPPWPDGAHVSASLREFGLVAELDGTPSLVNYVTHPVINKDPTSALERTIWLVF